MCINIFSFFGGNYLDYPDAFWKTTKTNLVSDKVTRKFFSLSLFLGKWGSFDSSRSSYNPWFSIGARLDKGEIFVSLHWLNLTVKL